MAGFNPITEAVILEVSSAGMKLLRRTTKQQGRLAELWRTHQTRGLKGRRSQP